MENGFENIPAEKFEFADRRDISHDKKFETKPVGYFQDAFRRFCKNKGSIVGAVVIIILVLAVGAGIYLSFALVYLLEPLVGIVGSYALLGALFLVLIAVVVVVGLYCGLNALFPQPKQVSMELEAVMILDSEL